METVPRFTSRSTALSVRVEHDGFHSLGRVPVPRLEEATKDADRRTEEKTP